MSDTIKDEETSKQRSNTALYIAAFIIMLLLAAGLATLGSYFLPLLFFTVFSSALLMGAIGLLLGLEISLIIASLRRNIDEDAFLPDQTERSYAIVVLGMFLGVIAALLLAIAFPSALGLFAFAGLGAFAILGALGLITGLAIVSLIFLVVDLLRISPHAFEKLSMAQPFKGISRLMGLKELELQQAKMVDKDSVVQKADADKEKPPEPEVPRENNQEEKKKDEAALDSSSASLVITALPSDGGSGDRSSSPASAPVIESSASFEAPTSAHHDQDEHKDAKAIVADSELVAAIPKQLEGEYNKFISQNNQPKGFFQLLSTKLAALAPPQSSLTGALKDLDAACKLIASSRYPDDTGLKFLMQHFERLEANLEAYSKESGSNAKGLAPLAQGVEEYKVALIIQACLDPRYDAESKEQSARETRAKFIKNASPEVIEKVRRGLQAHIASLKEGEGAEARNSEEIARLGKVIEDGLRKPGVAVEPK